MKKQTCTKERSINQLLIILKNKARLSRKWFFGEPKIYSGLCLEISSLHERHLITSNELDILNDYFRMNTPGDYTGYVWEPELWKPRLKWLNEHIELTK